MILVISNLITDNEERLTIQVIDVIDQKLIQNELIDRLSELNNTSLKDKIQWLIKVVVHHATQM